MVEYLYKNRFPTTRYQGSKKRYVEKIFSLIPNLKYDTVLDIFGGTGAMSYGFKCLGKQVFYNDILKSNYHIGRALIENSSEQITPRQLSILLKEDNGYDYSSFISDNFKDIYYYNDENAWLDHIRYKIQKMQSKYPQSMAYFALFQSCLMKRPYNLFHRKNLNFRNDNWIAPVTFGNKTTWKKPFEELFHQFVDAANIAVFSNGQSNYSLNYDAFNIPEKFDADLIYLDPPYMNIDGLSPNYRSYYHFLDGLTMTDKQWKRKIDEDTPNKRFMHESDAWLKKTEIKNAFDTIFEKYQDRIIVLSYRDPGIPSVRQLRSMLKKYKSNVSIRHINQQFALANKIEAPKRNGQILAIGY